MVIKSIRNDEDHNKALLEVQRLWGEREGTAAGDRLELLITLTDAYERVHFPVDLPDLIYAIHSRLKQQGLEQPGNDPSPS